MKAYDLTGATSDSFDDPKTKNYSAVARELLKLCNISRKTVDEWRTTCGVEIIQKAILAKVKQSSAFRQHLLETGEKLIVHSFASDDFFGSGCPVKYIKDWSESMVKSGIILKYPISFPLTIATTKYVPTLAKGRNMLGAIYIALREQIKLGNLEQLHVELTPVSELVKIVVKSTPRPVETNLRRPPATTSDVNRTPITKLRDLYYPPPVVHQPMVTAMDPNQAYLQQQYPRQTDVQMYQQSVASNYTTTNQRYIAAEPVRYTQEPEAMDATPQRTLEDVYNMYRTQQQQQPVRPTYASLAAQNQDFSADVDQQNAAFANVRRIPEAPRPPNVQPTSNFQSGYEWT
uniref:NADAR domain-containing protein n=1 Tax=Panagrolaimus sp. JU765 TaxID=591449 RepID=A0AC34R3L1_9BILA